MLCEGYSILFIYFVFKYEPIDVLRLLCHGNMDIFFECQLSQDLQWHIDHLVARKLSETFHNPESPEGLVFLEMLVEGAQGLQVGMLFIKWTSV